MKRLIRLLGLFALVIASSLLTYLIVTKIDTDRLNRTQDKYEAEISKLENNIKELQRKVPGAIPIAAPVPVVAPVTMVRYDAATAGSKCRIDGTSSVHPWKMETAIIGGYFEVDAKVNLDPAQSAVAGLQGGGRVTAAAEAVIPVRSLKSYTARMDEVYQDTMEAITFRKIEYHLKELALSKNAHAPNTPLEFQSRGELIVHGVTNELSMPVKIERVDGTRLKIAGQTPLKMTDFKVTPPAPTIGGIKISTGNEITVSFEWVIARSKPNLVEK